MRVMILGAAGVIGQHMRLCAPVDVETMYCRRSGDEMHHGFDLLDVSPSLRILNKFGPDVIVNLAGESNTDVVERDSSTYEWINVSAPQMLLMWARERSAHLIHTSTQAVFSGNNAPYATDSRREPINEYGRQKKRAEDALMNLPNVTIIRPTFVLGVRPFPQYGRVNPVEQMLAGQRKQVSDRWFSPSFAPDVAACIWDAVQMQPGGVIHAGIPLRFSRYDIACHLGVDAEPVSHDSFTGIAPRPVDTSYAAGSWQRMFYFEGIQDCLQRYEAREAITA